MRIYRASTGIALAKQSYPASRMRSYHRASAG